MKCEPSQDNPKIQNTLSDVLVVDTDPRTTDVFRAGLWAGAVIRQAGTIEQASLELRRKAADLVVVNLQIGDNAGVELLARVRKNFPQSQTVAISRSSNPDLCLTALRAGASDMLVGPLTVIEVKACVERATQRRTSRDQMKFRNQRLRSVCRQLNKARHEISQQVNLLCHDLVKAYQDLAEQLNQTQVCGDFVSAVGDDVEIEPLMRRTMEWILKKLGPVNAAVFLPDSEHNFTLGAYLNFDTNAESVLLDVVSHTVAPHAADGNTCIQVDSDRELYELFGDESSLLVRRSWLACGSFYRNECLAVIVVFRSQSEPFDAAWSGLLEAVAPVLGERIARAIRVYQRNHVASGPDESNLIDGPDEHDESPDERDELDC